MAKDISTLIEDIENLVAEGFKPDPEAVKEFGEQLGRSAMASFAPRTKETYLRMSNIGVPDRKLWYSINAPELGEDLSPSTIIKFAYGHILEDLLLFLAHTAGHEVVGMQSDMEVLGIKGHRDAVIDGMLVDSKSASSYSFKKFKEHRLEEDDAFGYIPQLNAYLKASQDDPLLTVKDKFAFLVIDKTLGHVCLDVHERKDVDIEAIIEHKKRMLGGPLPPRCYPDEPDGKSGNRKLGAGCSYCPFKQSCWPGLQVYHYSNGPRYLTQVAKEPRVEKADAKF